MSLAGEGIILHLSCKWGKLAMPVWVCRKVEGSKQICGPPATGAWLVMVEGIMWDQYTTFSICRLVDYNTQKSTNQNIGVPVARIHCYKHKRRNQLYWCSPAGSCPTVQHTRLHLEVKSVKVACWCDRMLALHNSGQICLKRAHERPSMMYLCIDHE